MTVGVLKLVGRVREKLFESLGSSTMAGAGEEVATTTRMENHDLCKTDEV